MFYQHLNRIRDAHKKKVLNLIESTLVTEKQKVTEK